MLDGGGPIDEGVAPFIADPAWIAYVLERRVDLPLAAAGDLILMAEESLELHQIRILVALRLEALPTSDIAHLLLSLENHLELDAIIGFVLPW